MANLGEETERTRVEVPEGEPVPGPVEIPEREDVEVERERVEV